MSCRFFVYSLQLALNLEAEGLRMPYSMMYSSTPMVHHNHLVLDLAMADYEEVYWQALEEAFGLAG